LLGTSDANKKRFNSETENFFVPLDGKPIDTFSVSFRNRCNYDETYGLNKLTLLEQMSGSMINGGVVYELDKKTNRFVSVIGKISTTADQNVFRLLTLQKYIDSHEYYSNFVPSFRARLLQNARTFNSLVPDQLFSLKQYPDIIYTGFTHPAELQFYLTHEFKKQLASFALFESIDRRRTFKNITLLLNMGVCPDTPVDIGAHTRITGLGIAIMCNDTDLLYEMIRFGAHLFARIIVDGKKTNIFEYSSAHEETRLIMIRMKDEQTELFESIIKPSPHPIYSFSFIVDIKTIKSHQEYLALANMGLLHEACMTRVVSSVWLQSGDASYNPVIGPEPENHKILYYAIKSGNELLLDFLIHRNLVQNELIYVDINNQAVTPLAFSQTTLCTSAYKDLITDKLKGLLSAEQLSDAESSASIVLAPNYNRHFPSM